MYTKENVLKHTRDIDFFEGMPAPEQGAFLGMGFQSLLIKTRNAQKAYGKGLDMIENGLKKEIKTCWSYNRDVARWQSLWSKKGRCHFIIFFDGVASRLYEVPHDVVFNEMKISKLGEIRATKHNQKILDKYEKFDHILKAA